MLVYTFSCKCLYRMPKHTFVDDLMYCYEDQIDIKEVVFNLNKKIEVKCFGDTDWKRRWQFSDNSKAKDPRVVGKSGTAGYQIIISIPMESGFHKQKEPSELFSKNNGYKEATGKMLYLSTRPDISSPLGMLCRKTSSPTQKDWTGI